MVCMAATAGAQAPASEGARRLADSMPLRELVWRAGAADERPVFHGVVSYDTAGGGAGGMLYPAPGAAGLLVAILTHAAINEGARSAEAKRIEEAADQVLTPFRPAIGRLGWHEIQLAALARLDLGVKRRLLPPGESAGDAWLVDTRPVFRMTQDRRALVMEAVVRVFDGDAAVPFAERAVRVVSPPVKAEDAESYWTAGDGARLAQTSAALAAEAVRAALLDAQATGEMQQRTVRFVEGQSDRFERASPLAERCDRVVLRTLRGGVMSVPQRAKAGADLAAADGGCLPWPDPGPVAAVAEAGLSAAPANGPDTTTSTASVTESLPSAPR